MNTETFFEYQYIQHGKSGICTYKKFNLSFLKIKRIQKRLKKELVYRSMVAGINKLAAI